MAVNIDQLCIDAEALVGKAKYTDKSAGQTECCDYAKLLTGKYTVMCAGLIVALCKKQGLKVYNGSNTIFRKYLSDAGSISDHTSLNKYTKEWNPLASSQLKKGMLVFKWSSSGEPSYYAKDGLGNYQHIGIVTSVAPLHIVHSTSVNKQGIIMDTKIGTWCAWGKLNGISYQNSSEVTEEVTNMTSGTLITNSRMRIRQSKTVTSKMLGSIPSGTTIEFEGDFNSGWVSVNYKGTSGYMCTTSSDYATLLTSSDSSANDESSSDIEKRLSAIESRVKILEECMSNGVG